MDEQDADLESIDGVLLLEVPVAVGVDVSHEAQPEPPKPVMMDLALTISDITFLIVSRCCFLLSAPTCDFEKGNNANSPRTLVPALP
eukprot:m.274375 g.274375  ORF g.274375 m.274375 type:complete len:87 (+) comp54830_c1_seq8:1305-1565(+)